MCRVPAVIVTALALITLDAQAAILSGTGTNGDVFTQLDPPPVAVGNNNQQANDTVFAFDEKQDQVLAQAIDLDLVPTGGLTTLPAGTAISSHYVFADPQGSINRVTGSVTFFDNILGIIFDDARLDATNFLGTAGSYSSPSLLGLESADTVTISAADTVTINFSAGSPGDYIRVITQGVPEPASLPVLALGISALIGRPRRR